MKAKITLGDKVTIKAKEVFVGTQFSVNENGGMGGGHFYVYAKGEPDKFIQNADSGSMVKVETIDGYTKYINLQWCNQVTKINICKIIVPLIKWNGKYGSECDHYVLRETKTVFLNLFLEEDVDVSHDNTSSQELSVKGGCKIIYD